MLLLFPKVIHSICYSRLLLFLIAYFQIWWNPDPSLVESSFLIIHSLNDFSIKFSRWSLSIQCTNPIRMSDEVTKKDLNDLHQLLANLMVVENLSQAVQSINLRRLEPELNQVMELIQSQSRWPRLNLKNGILLPNAIREEPMVISSIIDVRGIIIQTGLANINSMIHEFPVLMRMNTRKTNWRWRFLSSVGTWELRMCLIGWQK